MPETPESPAETPEVETPAETPEVEQPKDETPAPVTASADLDKIRNEAIAAERERVTKIRAWAGDVEKVQNIDLSEVADKFIADGKSVMDFKEHVITNTFKAATLATPTDTNGAAGKSLPRAQFDAMTPAARLEFIKAGGSLKD